MDFNALLTLEGFDLGDVALAMHKPGTLAERRVLSTLAEEDEAAFNAYQSTHPAIQEATLKSRRYMVSFVITGTSDFGFVGLYENRGHRPAGPGYFEQVEPFVRMLAKIDGVTRREAIGQCSDYSNRVHFDLIKTEILRDLQGRLMVSDPGARNYMRLPETTRLRIAEVKREARIVPPMPPWDEFCVTAQELASLPRDWAIQLASWRGVYLIVDQSDGARYVGAAYGAENLLGRWRAHVAKELGVTRELSKRPTGGFRFTILDLLSPGAEIEEVTARERNWMLRLDTIENGLNA